MDNHLVQLIKTIIPKYMDVCPKSQPQMHVVYTIDKRRGYDNQTDGGIIIEISSQSTDGRRPAAASLIRGD